MSVEVEDEAREVWKPHWFEFFTSNASLAEVLRLKEEEPLLDLSASFSISTTT